MNDQESKTQPAGIPNKPSSTGSSTKPNAPVWQEQPCVLQSAHFDPTKETFEQWSSRTIKQIKASLIAAGARWVPS